LLPLRFGGNYHIGSDAILRLQGGGDASLRILNDMINPALVSKTNTKSGYRFKNEYEIRLSFQKRIRNPAIASETNTKTSSRFKNE